MDEVLSASVLVLDEVLSASVLVLDVVLSASVLVLDVVLSVSVLVLDVVLSVSVLVLDVVLSVSVLVLDEVLSASVLVLVALLSASVLVFGTALSASAVVLGLGAPESISVVVLGLDTPVSTSVFIFPVGTSASMLPPLIFGSGVVPNKLESFQILLWSGPPSSISKGVFLVTLISVLAPPETRPVTEPCTSAPETPSVSFRPLYRLSFICLNPLPKVLLRTAALKPKFSPLSTTKSIVVSTVALTNAFVMLLLFTCASVKVSV